MFQVGNSVRYKAQYADDPIDWFGVGQTNFSHCIGKVIEVKGDYITVEWTNCDLENTTDLYTKFDWVQ